MKSKILLSLLLLNLVSSAYDRNKAVEYAYKYYKKLIMIVLNPVHLVLIMDIMVIVFVITPMVVVIVLILLANA